MSAQKKKPQESAAGVDWAERLKAAMNESPAEPQAPVPEEDDLAVLLRAQLARRDETAAVSMDLDTRDFEEEPEEIFEVETQEDPEGDLEEVPAEEPEESPITEATSEPDGSEREDDTLPWEEDGLPWEDEAPHAPAEDGREEPAYESYGDDDIIPDELPEPITVTVYRAEPARKAAEPDSPAAPAPFTEDEPTLPAADTTAPTIATVSAIS